MPCCQSPAAVRLRPCAPCLVACLLRSGPTWHATGLDTISIAAMLCCAAAMLLKRSMIPDTAGRSALTDGRTFGFKQTSTMIHTVNVRLPLCVRSSVDHVGALGDLHAASSASKVLKFSVIIRLHGAIPGKASVAQLYVSPRRLRESGNSPAADLRGKGEDGSFSIFASAAKSGAVRQKSLSWCAAVASVLAL